jgi:hypothetical protein
MRRLQRRTRPQYDPVDVRSGQLNGIDVDRLLAMTAPDSHGDMLLIANGAFNFSEP